MRVKSLVSSCWLIVGSWISWGNSRKDWLGNGKGASAIPGSRNKCGMTGRGCAMTSKKTNSVASVFVREREITKRWAVVKSGSLVSLGLMLMLACVWFWLDANNDSAQANVEVVQRIVTKSEFNKNVIPTEPIEDNVPNLVEIKDLGIKMTVVPQVAKDGKVVVSDTKANYLVGSGVVGEVNNIVVYAHKRRGMFGNLSKIKIGSKIVLKSKDRIGEYEVVNAYETRNNDMTVVTPDGFYGLTLYTCNRWDDSYRFVVKGKEVRTYLNNKK